MRRFREPFYIAKKHVIIKYVSMIVSFFYIISTLIGIYISSFGSVISTDSIVSDAVFHAPREVIVHLTESQSNHSNIYSHND